LVRILRIIVPLVLSGSLALPSAALEKTALRADRSPADGWDAGASCYVTYANICTGWLWLWNEWEPDEVIGVVLDPCCSGGFLAETQVYFWTGAPVGYGFTGVLTISRVANGCPGQVINSRPLLPVAGPVVDAWDAPFGPVALTYTCGPGKGSPHGIVTDHPAAGPTGPEACGLCYPSTRPTHSFHFGTPTSPLCPGSPWSDGACNAEIYGWSGGFLCQVGVGPSTWGAVKNLYR
jgi:hypothetical protein